MKKCKRVMALMLIGMLLTEGGVTENCMSQEAECDILEPMVTAQQPTVWEPSETIEVTKEEEKSVHDIRVAVLDSGYTGEENDRIVDSKANFSDSGQLDITLDDNGHGSAMTDII